MSTSDTPPAAPVAPSPAGRRLASPSWLDLRLVLGIALVAASVLLGAVVVSSADRTRPVLTARRDLAVGTVLRPEDLRVSRVRLDGAAPARYLRELSAAVGRTLVRPVSSDELVPVAAVVRSPARTTLTVALAEGAAPDLHSGQRIQLWLSSPVCAFVVVLAEVTVQSVRRGAEGSFGGSGDGQRVVITVAPELAPRVVAAQSVQDATLRAGILTGSADADRGAADPSNAAAPSSSGVAPNSGVTPGSPGASAAGLPADLAACAGSGGSR